MDEYIQEARKSLRPTLGEILHIVEGRKSYRERNEKYDNSSTRELRNRFGCTLFALEATHLLEVGAAVALFSYITFN